MPPRRQTYRPRLPSQYVTLDSTLERVAWELSREPVVALDVETTLDTQALRLIQLATTQRVVIVDPLAVQSLEPLRAVFESGTVVKVIHNASFERTVLGKLGFKLVNVFDTMQASRSAHPETSGHGLAAVCKRELSYDLDKSKQTSNWSQRPLSPEQLAYAAVDVEVLLPLHRRLGFLTAPLLWGASPGHRG